MSSPDAIPAPAARPAPAAPAARPAGRLRRGLASAVAFFCWAYAAAVAGLWLLVLVDGDRTWPTTVFLFGPRWVLALPLAPLAALALALRRRALLPLLAAGGVVLGPLLGFCLPPLLGERAPRGPVLRVMTLNAGGTRVDGDALAAFVARAAPDVVAVQECHPKRVLPRISAAPGAPWHTDFDSDAGVCLASRHPFRKVAVLDREALLGGASVHYEIATPHGPIQLFQVHLETPRAGLEALLERKRAGIEEMQEVLRRRDAGSRDAGAAAQAAAGPTVVAGDFNMPVESALYRRDWGVFANAFSEVGAGFGHTKRTEHFGARIDHILANPSRLRVLTAEVGPHVGSDHLPVLAEIEIAP